MAKRRSLCSLYWFYTYYSGVRFATYGGEPKEAHRISLGLPKQTQRHSPRCSLPKVANTSGGEGSEPSPLQTYSLRHLWWRRWRLRNNAKPELLRICLLCIDLCYLRHHGCSLPWVANTWANVWVCQSKPKDIHRA